MTKKKKKKNVNEFAQRMAGFTLLFSMPQTFSDKLYSVSV